MIRMKKWAATGVLAVVIALAGVDTSRAGDDGWAAFGGFVGGTILAGLTHGYQHHPTHYSHVTVSHPGVYEVKVSGHRYEERQVWHDGYWSYEYDRCGHRIKTWNPGYYTVEQVQVYAPSYSHSYHSYGYASHGSYSHHDGGSHKGHSSHHSKGHHSGSHSKGHHSGSHSDGHHSSSHYASHSGH